MSDKEQQKAQWLLLLEEQTKLLREIRDLLKPKKSPPRNLPPTPSPADDPSLPKKKLVFNEHINSWQWENDK